MPLRSGRLTSNSMRSKGRSSSRDSPSRAVSALATRYPSVFNKSSRPSRISDSSSTTSIEPLDMGGFPNGWEFNMERGSSAGGGSYVALAGVVLADPVAHAKAEPGAAGARLGGEKGIKNLMNVLAGNAVARIRDFDFH